MTFESWNDAMFLHGSMIGYMAGVKSACKDEDKSSLLLRMADTQARLEFMESENAKLRELVRDMWRFTGTACKKYPRLFDPSAQGGQTVQLNAIDAFEQRMHKLGIEV